jgi:hypothetical protein
MIKTRSKERDKLKIYKESHFSYFYMIVNTRENIDNIQSKLDF